MRLNIYNNVYTQKEHFCNTEHLYVQYYHFSKKHSSSIFYQKSYYYMAWKYTQQYIWYPL